MKMPHPPWSPWIQIRAVVASPHQPGLFLAGSDIGLHISVDNGGSWEFMTSPADRHQVWSIAFDPTDPKIILAGVAPFESHVNIIRTGDGGQSWQVLNVPAPSRSIVGATHITAVHFDPRDRRTIWATCELGGLYRSRDSGDSWTQIQEKLGDRRFAGDVHSILVTPQGRIFATSPEGVWISDDDARSFRLHAFPAFPDPEPAGLPDGIVAYSRGITQKADDPDVIFIGTGDYTPGRFGAIQRTVDGGESWEPAPLTATANSHFYCIASNRADPNFLAAATMFGYVYVSDDGGARWRKLSREFGEIRGLAWAPSA
jgi:photosystem II stability/assembly factor-like uncharacterized protein